MPRETVTLGSPLLAWSAAGGPKLSLVPMEGLTRRTAQRARLSVEIGMERRWRNTVPPQKAIPSLPP